MKTKLNYLTKPEAGMARIELLDNESIKKKGIAIPAKNGANKIGNVIFVRTQGLVCPNGYEKKQLNMLSNVIERVIRGEVMKNPQTRYFIGCKGVSNREGIRLECSIIRGYRNASRFKLEGNFEDNTLENLYFDATIEGAEERVSTICKLEYDLGPVYNKMDSIIDCMLEGKKSFYEMLTRKEGFGSLTYFVNIYNDLQDEGEEKSYSVIDTDLKKYHDRSELEFWKDDKDLREFLLSKEDYKVYIAELYGAVYPGERFTVKMESSNDPYFNYSIHTDKGKKIWVNISYNEVCIKDDKIHDYLVQKMLKLPVDN